MRYKIALLLLLLIPQVCWGGIDFDGTDDYVNGTDAFYSDALTISAWVYVHVASKTIITKRNSSGVTSGNLEWNLYENTDSIGLDAWTTGGTQIIDGVDSAAGSLPLNTWTHIVGVVPGNGGTAAVYINGSQSGTTSTQSGTVLNTTSLIQLGVRTANNDTRYFDGIISEFAIWDMALTAAQITQLASSRTKGMPLQLKDPDNDGTVELKIYLPINNQPDGTSADGDTVIDLMALMNGTGVDGANNTGLTWQAETILSYPDEFAQ